MRTAVVILRNPNLLSYRIIENSSFFPVVFLHIFFIKKAGLYKSKPGLIEIMNRYY